MNTNEGLMRIAKVVRWIGYFIISICSIGLLYATFGDVVTRTEGATNMILIGVSTYVLSTALAWVIEGFAKPK